MFLIGLFVVLLIIGVLGYLFQFMFAVAEVLSDYSDIKTRQQFIDAFIPFRPLYLKIKDIWNK